MQYSTRSLFAFVAACALLIGYVALPMDLKGFVVVSSVLLAGVVCCFYTAFSKHISEWRAAVIVLACAAAFAIVMLSGPLRDWLRQ